MRQYRLTIALLAITAIFSLTSLKAQDWQYSQHFATSHGSEIRGLTLDSDTNLYVTSFHKNNLTLTGPSGSESFVTSGAQDIVIAKFNPSGDILWTDSIHGTKSDYPRQIELDNNEDLYITGIYRNSALTIQDEVLASPGENYYDIFLAKYTKTGGDVFAKRVAWGGYDDRVDKISVDLNNNVYMTGTYQDTLFFEGDTLLNPYKEDTAYVFLAKFKPNGDFIWAKSISQTLSASLLEIGVSSDTVIYMCGYFSGAIDYDGTILNTYGDNDALLIKTDSAGNLRWMKQEGGTGYDRANGLAIDQTESLYLTGTFSGSADFSGTSITSAGGTDIFAARYNRSGDLTWVTSDGGAGSDIAYGAKLRENLLQTTGAFSGTLLFNNKALTTQSTSVQNPIFFVFDTDGNPITAEQLKTNNINTNNRAEYIEYDLSGNTYIGGVFRADTLFVGNDSLVKLADSGTDPRDGFVAKFVNPFSATFSTATNNICYGASEGELSVTSYFGTEPYVYEWSPNVLVSDGGTASELPAGDYWLKVTDAVGDTVRIYETISEPTEILITTDSTNITCNAANDGTLLAEAVGGTLLYAYNWIGGNAVPGDSVQSALVPGKYMLSVTDANGCEAKDSVTLTQPDAITFGPVSMVIESPIDSYTGKIFLDVNGGTPTYSFEWDSAGVALVGEVTDSLVNRTEGAYTVKVTDGNLCEVDTTILLLGESFRVQAMGTNVTCYGLEDGQAVARIVSGGDEPPFTFTWTDSLGTDITSTPDSIISDLEPGWYYVVAEDNLGAISEDSVLITQPDTLEVSLLATAVNCYGDNSGTVMLSLSGGTLPVSYAWSNAAETQSISELLAGWYIVDVVDANGCALKDSAEIVQNDSIHITFNEVTTLACNGDSDGVLQAIVTGGSGTYSSYQWNDLGAQTNPTAVGLPARGYTVTVSDDLMCVNSATHDFTDPEPLVAVSIDSMNVSCIGTSSGRIDITMAGGTEPYSYDWTLGLPDTNVVENLSAAPYSVTVTDANDCEADGITVTIEEPSTTLSLVENEGAHADNTCYESNDGSLSVTATGGWDNYQYSINTLDWQKSNTFSDLEARTYTVAVRDTGSCAQTVQVEITEPNEIAITGEQVTGNQITIIATGGTEPLSYVLDGTGTPQSSGQFDNLDDGTYFVEVTDVNNCGPARSNDIDINTTAIGAANADFASIYPNPATGLVNIEFIVPESGAYALEVYSLTGAVVHAENLEAYKGEHVKLVLDLTGVNAGIYMMKLNGVVLNSKLIIE